MNEQESGPFGLVLGMFVGLSIWLFIFGAVAAALDAAPAYVAGMMGASAIFGVLSTIVGWNAWNR